MSSETTEESQFPIDPISMSQIQIYSIVKMSRTKPIIYDDVKQFLYKNYPSIYENNPLYINDSYNQINPPAESDATIINYDNLDNVFYELPPSSNLLIKPSDSFELPEFINYLEEPIIKEIIQNETDTEKDTGIDTGKDTEIRKDLQTKKQQPTSNGIVIVKVEKPNTFLEKQRGRISKLDKAKGKNGIHTNIEYDNLTIRIKLFFRNSCLEFINYLLEKHKKNFLLKKMSGESSKNIKVDKMLDWFNETLKSYLSSDISSKYRNVDKKFNQMTIMKIYNDDELQEVTNVLNHTIREMYDKYINNEVIEGFKTLKDTLEVLKKEGQEENYIQKFENIALDLVEIIEHKTPRQSKKSKAKKK